MPAAIRIRMSGLVSWLRKIFNELVVLPVLKVFRPKVRRRAAASSAERPVLSSVSKNSAVSVDDMCQNFLAREGSRIIGFCQSFNLIMRGSFYSKKLKETNPRYITRSTAPCTGEIIRLLAIMKKAIETIIPKNPVMRAEVKTVGVMG